MSLACGSPDRTPGASSVGATFPGTHPREHRALVGLEQELKREPTTYAHEDPSQRFRPEGAYFDPIAQELWVWSSRHQEQRGFVRLEGRWQPAPAPREGPSETRRCASLGRTASTLCLGRREPGGFRSYGVARFDSQLPRRGGFVDFAVDEPADRIYVLDAYDDALWVLDGSGAVIGQRPIGPSAYRVGLLGSAHLFVLAGAGPRLSIVPTDPSQAVVELHPEATIRAATFDPSAGLLWTAGYRQERVRRNHGYIENLESFVYAYRQRDLVAGSFEPVRAVDLSVHKLVDAVDVLPLGRDVFTVAAGSGRVARVGAEHAVESHRSALVPKSLLAVGDQLVTTGYVDGRVFVHARGDLSVAQVLELDPESHDSSPYDLGEVLFYTKAMWSDAARNQFTCNSCHWDGLTDHRFHPGKRESRWEQIRPAAGVGMLSPIFSPGQSPSLTVATHGFVRALDERFWTNPEGRNWLEDVRLDVASARGTHAKVLTPYDVRLALMTYLTERSVEPGLLRAPGQPFSATAVRGASIFWRDCARCHRPAVSASAPATMSLEEGLRYLVDRPLAFSAARREKTGVLPYFTRKGNRVSPLTQLSRGGPYFSNGSSATLREAIERTDPSSNAVHAPANAEHPAYTEAETRALIDFLLSI